MKSIMISIQPQWVEKILNGEKTIEIRKTMPKCELPVKVYIYCTNTKNKVGKNVVPQDYLTKPNYLTKRYVCGANYDECINGKVVAEFTLNKIDFIKMPINLPQEFLEKSCLNGSDIMNYLGGNFYKDFYAWHIDSLKIYDKPKELNEFKSSGYCFNDKNITIKKSLYGDYVGDYHKNSFCKICKYYDSDWGDCTKTIKPIKRPPQSWCYVEGIDNE